MQFIERNNFSIRAAVYTLKHPADQIEFVLFPMIHVGAPEYYRDVRNRLQACDQILFEGVAGVRSHIFTTAYRFMVRRKRLGLVTQDELKLGGLRDKLIHADVDATSFEAAWAKLPLRLRAFLICVVPFFAGYLFLFATRETIAKRIEITDLPTREEILESSEESEKLDELLLHERDARLITVIRELHSKSREQSLKVAILYGAAHMRGVSRYLMTGLGYRIIRGDWVTVFEL